jgi:lipoyl(octanoyl) transferase
MGGTPRDPLSSGPAMEAHLLGQVAFADCLALQQQIAGQIGLRDDGQICLLLCEHPPVITVGRGGSPGDVRHDAGSLRSREIEVRWVKRGGPSLVHSPGQLAAYLIAPLRWHGLTVGGHLDRLQAGLLGSLRSLGVAAGPRPGRHGLWGRTGQLAALGVSVRDWTTMHGAFLNVSPPMGLFRLVESDPVGGTPMSCLVAEQRKPVRMTAVRAELVRRLAEAFGCDRYHLHTGHPLLRPCSLRQ